MALTISATDTELPKPLNAVFNQTLLRNARVRAPYFAGTMPGDLVRQRGSNVAMWRRIENLSANTTALTELTGAAAYMQARDSAALSVTNVTATLTKYGNFVILNEEAQLFNFPGQFDKILEVIGINAGQSVNQLQRNIAEDNLTVIRTGAAASDGTVAGSVVLNDIKNAINQLERNSAMTFTPMTTGALQIGTVPITMAYWAICHPDVAIDVAALSGFTSIEKYAGQVSTVLGEFGQLTVAGVGVRFLASEDASIDAGAGASGAASAGLRGTSDVADLYTIVVYGRDCLGSVGMGEAFPDGTYRAGDDLATVDTIVKTPGGTGTSDPYNEITTIAWKTWHTGAVLNANWGRAIRVGATVVT